MEISARIAAAFAERIGAARFHLWFPPNAVFAWNSGELLVACRNDHFRDWAGEQFGNDLTAAAAGIVGGEIALRFSVEPSRFEESVVEIESTKKAKPAANLFGEREAAPAPKPPRTARRWKSFAEFVVGASNRVAAAAVQSIGDELGAGPNPLVIHGPVGTGKTHLLEAAVAAWKPAGGPALFLTAEEFTHRFIQAARTQRGGSFRKLTRSAGLLAIDNLDFLANKKATQEELTHVIDSYLAEGKPILLSLDCHPRLSDDLLPELVDRLLGGAAWGLLPPDGETRLAILKAKAPPLADDVLKYLARHLTGNVRELEGAMHSLRHYGKVTGEPITLALAKDLLGDLLRHTVRAITLADVDAAACKVFGLGHGALQSKARTAAVTQPRMTAIYLARKHTAATYGEIAKHFGVRQHSTAMAAEKKVRAWLEERSPVADLILRIERELMK